MIFGLAGAALIMFGVILVLAVLAFEVFMFVDAIRNPRLTDTEKILWCLGMIFIHPIVAIVYYFVARSGISKPVA